VGGTQFRLLVHEPVRAWTPRRHCLGGVLHGAAVDDGGVGPVARATTRPCRLSAVQAGPLPVVRPGVPWKALVHEPWPPATTHRCTYQGIVHKGWGKRDTRTGELLRLRGL
jgi:hypothetical protein